MNPKKRINALQTNEKQKSRFLSGFFVCLIQEIKREDA